MDFRSATLEFVNSSFNGAATTAQECFEIWRHFVLQLQQDDSFSSDYVAEVLEALMQDIHGLQTTPGENSLMAVHYQALTAICGKLRSGDLDRSDSDVSFRKLHMGAMAFMEVFKQILVERPKQKELSVSMDALPFQQNIIEQKTQQLERLGGVVTAYEQQAIMLHMERSAQFAWHMQHKAGLQENIKSMTATIKQLEERNMFLEERNIFLERRHKSWTLKLEELLQEQRLTE